MFISKHTSLFHITFNFSKNIFLYRSNNFKIHYNFFLNRRRCKVAKSEKLFLSYLSVCLSFFFPRATTGLQTELIFVNYTGKFYCKVLGIFKLS